jgi:transposase
MVLGYSRMMYIEFAKRCDIHSFLSCLIHALQYFGGVPKTMLTDQMKTVILGMGDDRKPGWHPLFEDFCRNIPVQDVEVRSLDVYEHLAEVGA